MNIDVHTHIVPETFPAVGNRKAGVGWPIMDRPAPDTANVMFSGENFRTVLDRCWSVPRRVSELPEQGIDKQVLSPMPRLLAYELNPTDGLDLARYLNDTIVAMIAAEPDRFYGLGAVPLQDPAASTKELTRIQDMGLRGVEVLTNINGKNLADPEFRPFLKEAERLGLAIFSHAQNPTFAERVVGPAAAQNAIGFPIENGLAAGGVVTGGVLEECPNLRICFSHGGGVFTALLPRLQNAWSRPGPLHDALPKSPMDYARMAYWDDVLFNNTTVRYLIDIVGISQVVLGSDYPFGTRLQTPDDEFANLGLSDSEREAVGSLNALRFLGLDA